MTVVAKQNAEKIIQSLPDDASYDEILKELAFAKMIEQGLDDSENNRVISNEEMEQKILEWQS